MSHDKYILHLIFYFIKAFNFKTNAYYILFVGTIINYYKQ